MFLCSVQNLNVVATLEFSICYKTSLRILKDVMRRRKVKDR
jgi:hypothetical protein